MVVEDVLHWYNLVEIQKPTARTLTHRTWNGAEEENLELAELQVYITTRTSVPFFIIRKDYSGHADHPLTLLLALRKSTISHTQPPKKMK